MMLLVTGATGFVGTALLEECSRRGIPVHAAVRRASQLSPGIDARVTGDLDEQTDWSEALRDIDVVVHLAARVHQINKHDDRDEADYRRVNTMATLRLARCAAAAGVQRFVFVSSVKVNGEGRDQPYSEADRPDPRNPYAASKWRAEQGLRRIAAGSPMSITVLRPPLVYGPGVDANFRSLMHWIDRGRPLPLAAIDNRRSFLYVGNLVDAVLACAMQPAAANRTFLVSDGEDVSTPELIGRLARALGRRPRLIGVPAFVLRGAGRMLGHAQQVERLLGSLSVDSAALRGALDWSPPTAMMQGLAATAAWYRTLA